MTWEIFLGIVALVGFFITVGTPVLKLNSSIIRLTESVNVLRELIAKNEAASKEANQMLWAHMDGVDDSIKNHEERITKAEAAINAHGEKLTRIENYTDTQEGRITVIETKMAEHDKNLGK